MYLAERIALIDFICYNVRDIPSLGSDPTHREGEIYEKRRNGNHESNQTSPELSSAAVHL
jgi:hypothetical protein